MSYSKLFSSLVHSSLWTAEDHVRLLFVTLLAIADREGFVYGSRHGLERTANIRWGESAKGDRDPWEVLLSPDPDSSDIFRNPANQGRRIEEVPGGFRILNYLYYRSLRNNDDRKEQNRRAQQKFRAKSSTQRASAKISQRKPRSALLSPDKPQSAHAEAEAEAEADKETRVPVSACADKESETRLPVSNWLTEDDLWIDLQRILPEKERKRNVGLWISRIKENRKALYEAICDFKDKRNKARVANVGAWLTQRYVHFKHLGGTETPNPDSGPHIKTGSDSVPLHHPE